MRKRFRKYTAVCLVIIAALVVTAASSGLPDSSEGPGGGNVSRELLIDDFSDPKVSSFGTSWRLFTDQVMGGVSTANGSWSSQNGENFVRLRGEVSLENRGGFVQISLHLSRDGKSFDASGFSGVRIRVKGNENTYFVHLKSSQTVLPWQYFFADFFAGSEWTDIDIPLSAFRGENINSTSLNTSQLKRIAVVAAKRRFEADVQVSRIAFYE
jgi:hypothetical protein